MAFRRPLAAALLVAVAAGCGGKDESTSKSSGGGPNPTSAADQPSKVSGGYGYGYAARLGDDLDRRVGEAVKKGRAWLVGKRDAATGSWPSKRGPDEDYTVGVTALATIAVIAATPKDAVAKDPAVLQALEFLAAAQKANGAVYGNARVVNYETSAAVAALAQARVAKFGSAQAKAKDFLVGSQIQKDENADDYGGFPYTDEEPGPTDLSNLQFAVSALHEAGVPASDPVFARALKYLAKVQNRSETNTYTTKVTEDGVEKEVVAGNDGGGFYSPGHGKVPLVKRADGKYEVKSYGSMTYALLKCLLFAGLKADDPRVVAAVGWISKNFAVDRNPGFEATADPAKQGQQGYYYYLRTMARALSEFEAATGKALTVTDADAKPHAWRRELAAKILSLERADGSWINAIERWEEADPRIATSYALEALAICQGRLP